MKLVVFFIADLKNKMGVTNELLVRIKAEMEGVDVKICSAKLNLATAYFKGLLYSIDHTAVYILLQPDQLACE